MMVVSRQSGINQTNLIIQPKSTQMQRWYISRLLSCSKCLGLSNWGGEAAADEHDCEDR